MTDFRWLIEAPGQRYLAARKLGLYEFYWTEDHDKALCFKSEEQADFTMMAIRDLIPSMFGFAVTLGDAKAIEHGWMGSEAPAQEAPEPVAWRLTDGEGDYEYLTEEPSDQSRAWSRRYGREWEPLYASPVSSPPSEAAKAAPTREQLIECISRFDVFSTAAQVADAILALSVPPSEPAQVAASPVQDTWFVDRRLPIMAMSGDIEDDRVLRLMFRHKVTDTDRARLVEVLNAGETALAVSSTPYRCTCGAEPYCPASHHDISCPMAISSTHRGSHE